MIIFDYNTNIISQVVDELKKASEYIKLAIFQIHHRDIFQILSEKQIEGISIEILTLPYDSIDGKNRDEIIERFESLRKAGAILSFNHWNVGDPERTTTAVGRWYSYHGKFIVTDKAAISLSANLTERSELDAIIIYRDEKDKIDEFNRVFDSIKGLFINPHNEFDGKLRQLVEDTGIPNVENLFTLPRTITSRDNENTWILHYPSSLCPDVNILEDRLYIAPFDGKARSFVEQIIAQAERFVYISTESFTDPEIPLILRKNKFRNIDFKIITGVTSMDYQDRVNEMLLELISAEIGIKTLIDDEIHGKFIITDKHLMISSVNLNKMNLGFHKTLSFWRANTETITISTNNKILSDAKQRFLEWYNDQCYSVDSVITKNLEKEIGKLFTSLYGLSSKSEAKKIFAIYVIRRKIDYRKGINKIIDITSKLMRSYQKKQIAKDHIVGGIILFYLSERKHDLTQLNEKIADIDSSVDIVPILNDLLSYEFIEKDGDEYKININKLFSV